jgi:hypothetical protein
VFTGPASLIEGLFLKLFLADAQPDMDSAITETIGLGAFAHAASPHWHNERTRLGMKHGKWKKSL